MVPSISTWVIDLPFMGRAFHYTWGKRSFSWPPVSQWCHCISCGPTAYTASTWWSCCRHNWGTQHRGTCWISWEHQGQHQRPGLFHVDTVPLTSHASFPCPELGDSLVLGVRDEHQVISVEKLPWHTSSELMLKWTLDYILWMTWVAHSLTQGLLKACHRIWYTIKGFLFIKKAK